MTAARQPIRINPGAHAATETRVRLAPALTAGAGAMGRAVAHRISAVQATAALHRAEPLPPASVVRS
jgi:hypothetical protein